MEPFSDFVRAIVRETIAELAPHLRGDDELLTLPIAATIVAKTPRAIRDAGRRGDLEIVSVGRSPRVRRSALVAWARPIAAPTPATVDTMSPRAAARAAVAARAAGGGR